MEKKDRVKDMNVQTHRGNVLFPDKSFPYPIAVKGEGIYIIDKDGKRYLDGSSGAYVSSIGHALPEIAEAVYEQCKKLEFAHRTQFITEPLLQLTDWIASIAPGDLKTVYFTSSGSESNETAMKVARRYHILSGRPEKYMMLSRWLSYHGNTLGAQSLSGSTRLRDEDFPLLHDFPQVAPCYCFRCPFGRSYPGCDLPCAYDLEYKILKLGAKYVAAFFFEPVVGASCPGAVPPPEYFKIIREICNKYEVLMVADEVITSFGRLGRYFGMEHWSTTPDMITVGKGTSCAYSPLGATILSEKIYKVLQEKSGHFSTGHTLNFNPLSIATGLAVQKYMRDHDLVRKANPLGEYLFRKLRELQEKYPIVGHLRGKGLLAGLEFVKERDGMIPFPVEAAVVNKVAAAAMKEGLIIYPSRNGYQNKTLDFISVAPPLTITEQQIDELVGKLDAAIGKVKSNL
jgi:adenosylmethionine-8-amino-7-oxononanoate aminotransferase